MPILKSKKMRENNEHLAEKNRRFAYENKATTSQPQAGAICANKGEIHMNNSTKLF